ncbi:hypothetical protein Tco_1431314, partial [Tanacetum coccineum]
MKTRSQQAAIKNKGKATANSPSPTYNQEPAMIAEVDALQKEKEIDTHIALISFLFKKIYKPINNNLRTSSNTNRANHDNTLRINRGTRYDNQRAVKVVEAKENVGTQELEAHYMYTAKAQEVTPDDADNSRPIFNAKPLQNLVEIILIIIDSGCSKHMMGNLKLLRNVTTKRVYYIEGLNHNLFFVGQFYHADLEVAFWKSTCYVRDLKGNDLLT